MPVTKPTELTVTNVWLVSELVQVAKPVTSWVVPSLKLAVAVKFTDVPTWTGAGFGVMAIEVNVGFFVNPTLTSIAITPNPAPVQVGTSVNLTATANFSDGTTQDVTGLATWTSSDTSQTFVTVSSVGLVTGIQNTTSAITVTASYKNVSGTT